jgi:hypothetical protein
MALGCLPVHHLVLVSLIVFAVATVVGLAIVGVRGLVAWRAFRSFKRSTGELVAETNAKLVAAERRTAAVSERVAEIDRARERLQASLATAAVLSEAAGEVLAAYRRMRGVIPSK